MDTSSRGIHKRSHQTQITHTRSLSFGETITDNHNSSDSEAALLRQQRPLDEMSEESHGHHQSKAAATSASGSSSSSRYYYYCRSIGGRMMSSSSSSSSSIIRIMVLLILCLQNSLFTVLRRYSLGIRKEQYSKYELLLVGEIVKLLFSAYMIRRDGNNNNGLVANDLSNSSDETNNNSSTGHKTLADVNNKSSSISSSSTFQRRLIYLIVTSRKMMVLASIYGAMNILSLISLRNIGAGMFTIFAQCKILTTACCSTILLRRQYSWTQWRALIGLSFGVLLFSEPIWGKSSEINRVISSNNTDARPLLGTMAVLLEVSLSGFASIYFEKVIKTDPLQLSIWERNFQLALGSIPVYVAFILTEGGGKAGFGGGWSMLSVIVALLGAAGGLLVALSIKYGDSILKTLATTGAIILSSILDHAFLGGPLTPPMMIAGVQVILAICNYTFDTTPPQPKIESKKAPLASSPSSGSLPIMATSRSRDEDHMHHAQEEGVALLVQSKK